MNRILAIFAASVVPLGVHAAAVPSTQPAAGSEPTVLVLPVESPNGSYSWIGRAIQQDMLVDLTQMARARVLAPAGSPALDPDAALHSAREANANYVIFGSAQTSGAQLRVTGQVLDVTTGKSLSGLKATAPLDNLFPLEDALAMQVARALPTGVVREGALAGQPSSLPTIINGNPYVSEATPAPDYESVTAPDYTYGPDYYGYPYVYPPDYYYPGYGWGGLGWWGPGIVIGGRHHFGDHFGHFDHRSFISPHVNPGLHNRGFSGGHGFSHGSPGFGGARGGAMGGGHFGGGGHVGGGGGHAGGGGGRGR